MVAGRWDNISQLVHVPNSQVLGIWVITIIIIIIQVFGKYTNIRYLDP